MRRPSPGEQYPPGRDQTAAPSTSSVAAAPSAGVIAVPWLGRELRTGWRQMAIPTLVVAYFGTLAVYGVVQEGLLQPAPSTLYAPAAAVVLVLGARRWKVLKPWAPLVLVVLAYSALRDLGPGLAERADVLPPIHVDRFIGAGEIPTLRLQHLHLPGEALLDVVVTFGYLQHFIAPVITAIVLWKVDRARQRWFCTALIAVSLVGFATYIALPAAPPWWASEHGFVMPIDRTNHDTLGRILPPGLVTFAWSAGESDAVGAFPSVHAAWPLLISVALWPVVDRRWRWALFAYPLWVGFSLVYSGEHYLGDVLAGYAYALVIAALVSQAWETRALEVAEGTVRAGSL